MKQFKRRLSFAPLALLILAGVAQADTPLNVIGQDTAKPKIENKVAIEDMGWMDRNKMDKQLSKINDLTQTKLGSPLRKNYSDLDTLQRLVDKSLVDPKDADTQQAMGIAMGEVFLADFPHTLEWKIYRDNLGRSRALCAKGTQQCLFPVTMLSRRMEVGSKPNVRKIYNDAVNMMAEFLPKMPYGGEVLHALK